ncbi:MAG: hypothetical protein JWO36_3884 [Myxococcales bacterium]|nr:hypothetical protein [Myxococcales bacterium]
MRSTLLLLIALVFACKNESGTTQHEKPAEPVRKLAGVYPENFKCESIVTLEALGQLLGGAARQLEGAMTPPRGIAAPCNYEVAGAATEYWTFDFDCRDGMKQRADALFEQYRNDSNSNIQKYNELSDAGAIKPNDAGIVNHAPESAAEVAVGAKALDHHGQGLIFIDDDAPCYVRVVGPGFERRVELAKLIAKNLTFANAPMTPRPMP